MNSGHEDFQSKTIPPQDPYVRIDTVESLVFRFMTTINRVQVPQTALPDANGSLERLLVYAAAATRFHTLSMERVQLIDTNGAVSTYRPCSMAPVETPDKKQMVFIQAVMPLIPDPYSGASPNVWQNVVPYAQSAILTAGYGG